MSETFANRACFHTTRRVEFRDTDAAGIMHFSAFFPMMESVEHEFLRGIGIEVMPPHDDPDGVTWPRISVGCDFHGPARFEDVLDFTLHIVKIGDSSVRYQFEITCQDNPVATGKITAVCCRLMPGGKLTKATVPDSIRQAMLSASV